MPGNAVLLCKRHAFSNRLNARDNEEVASDLHHIGFIRFISNILAEHTTSPDRSFCSALQVPLPVKHGAKGNTCTAQLQLQCELSQAKHGSRLVFDDMHIPSSYFMWSVVYAHRASAETS